MSKTKAFALIELLIVVALLAVLALAAVPNYLEQQTRSKLSRVKSAQRTMSIALESFHADHQWYPPDGFPWNTGVQPNGCPWVQTELVPTWFKSMTDARNYNFWRTDNSIFLTTPVVYVDFAMVRDPFSEREPSTWWGGAMIWENYQDRNKWAQTQRPPYGPFERIPTIDGIRFPKWVLTSIGPDRVKDNAPVGKSGDPNMIYDPTNGTTSYGNVFRAR